jgi:hypothetical protein
MKRVLFILLSTVFGVAIGIVASFLLTSFINLCGEDCVREKLEKSFLCLIGGLVVFLMVATYLSHNTLPTLKKTFISYAFLSILFLMPFFIDYIYILHNKYHSALNKNEVETDSDFSLMIISTKQVEISIDNSGTSMVNPYIIKAWERCAIGSIYCEETPHKVLAKCKHQSGYIFEKNWNKFIRIPEEDTLVYQDDNGEWQKNNSSMNLCKK